MGPFLAMRAIRPPIADSCRGAWCSQDVDAFHAAFFPDSLCLWAGRSFQFPSPVGLVATVLLPRLPIPAAVGNFLIRLQVLGRQEYLDAAVRAGSAVWESGLLRKGPGICHGVSGNGYAFLALFRCTGNEEYLRKAVQVGLHVKKDPPRNLPFPPFTSFSWSAAVLHLGQLPRRVDPSFLCLLPPRALTNSLVSSPVPHPLPN